MLQTVYSALVYEPASTSLHWFPGLLQGQPAIRYGIRPVQKYEVECALVKPPQPTTHVRFRVLRFLSAHEPWDGIVMHVALVHVYRV